MERGRETEWAQEGHLQSSLWALVLGSTVGTGLWEAPWEQDSLPVLLLGLGLGRVPSGQYGVAQWPHGKDAKVRSTKTDVGDDLWVGAWMLLGHTLGSSDRTEGALNSKGSWTDLPGSIARGERRGQAGTLPSEARKAHGDRKQGALMQTSGCQAVHRKGLAQCLTTVAPHQTLGRPGCHCRKKWTCQEI